MFFMMGFFVGKSMINKTFLYDHKNVMLGIFEIKDKQEPRSI